MLNTCIFVILIHSNTVAGRNMINVQDALNYSNTIKSLVFTIET